MTTITPTPVTIEQLDPATLPLAAGTLTVVSQGGNLVKVGNDDLLPVSGVTAGSYTRASITVNAQGLVTAASSSGAGTVTSVTAGTGISVTGTAADPVVNIANTGVSAATYGSATASAKVAINAQGQVTSASDVTITPAVGSITGLGTGVATALAVNTGSAGAVVVNGGDLGTPSAGVATNLTGLPLSTGVTGTLPSANGGTGVNNGSSTITIGGNVTFSGASKFTGTLTSDTSVTFPTSGTLATTADIPTVEIDIGTTAIVNGGTTRLLYEDTGVVQESASLTWTDGSLALGIGNATLAQDDTTQVTLTGSNIVRFFTENANAGRYIFQGADRQFEMRNSSNGGVAILAGETVLATDSGQSLVWKSSNEGTTYGTLLAGVSGFTSSDAWEIANTLTVDALALPGGTSGAVTIQPAAVAGTWTLTLPTTDGNSGEALITDGAGVTSWGSVTAGAITVGTTTVGSGTDTRVLYDNAGTLGEYTISGTGSVAMTTSPAFTTPNLGTPSAAVLTSATGLPISTGLTGAGTGVLTALGVNVGTAGSVVVNGGALGTPSSGTLTNCTGLPVAGGGTGAATFTDGGVLIGNGTSAVQVTSAGTAGYAFNAGGAGVDPTWQNNGIRAHILFDGTGTPAARGTPYNVTSITDGGTGVYTINFTTALPSANYTAPLSCSDDGSVVSFACTSSVTPPTTSAIKILVATHAGVQTDTAYTSVVCIGG